VYAVPEGGLITDRKYEWNLLVRRLEHSYNWTEPTITPGSTEQNEPKTISHTRRQCRTIWWQWCCKHWTLKLFDTLRVKKTESVFEVSVNLSSWFGEVGVNEHICIGR
jgi:hypothetical protein